MAEAVVLSEQGLQAAIETNHVPTMTFAHGWRSLLAVLRNDGLSTFRSAKTLADLSEEHDLTFWKALGTMFLGHASVQMSADMSWLGPMREVVNSFREDGFRLYLTFFPSLLAQAEAEAGNIDVAVSLIEHALAESENTGQVWYVPELHRLRAGLALQKEPEGAAVGGHHARLALAAARAQEARSFARRSAAVLAALSESAGCNGLAEHLPELSVAVDEEMRRLQHETLDRMFSGSKR